jgi:hypothetical protein
LNATLTIGKTQAENSGERADFKTDLSGRAPGIAAQSRNAAIAQWISMPWAGDRG